MKSSTKILFGIVVIIASIFLYAYIRFPSLFNTTIRSSLKFSVGDCLQNGDEVYLFDSDGPVMKGSYGLLRIKPTKGDIGETRPIESVEDGSFVKVDCP